MPHKVMLMLLLLLCATTAAAQTVVEGRVTNLEGTGVPDVVVKALARERTVAFTTTKADGRYRLMFTAKGEATVSFRHVSYQTDTLMLAADERRHVADMVLLPKAIALQEVKVKAAPLLQQGDTLSYTLAAFLKKGDVTLEDGLKNLPGISISENGAISYMGQGISHFYIEGMNMLGGRYNLATRNIPAEYATQVEIMKHHRARKIDADEESNAVAINIKLSRRAKFKPFGTPVVGAGWSEDKAVGALGMTGMMFTDRFQLLASAKGSNYGDFGSYDMIDHAGSNDVSSLATDRLRAWSGGSAPVGQTCYQTNGYVSLNGVEKLDSVRELRVTANYTYEHSHNSFSTQTLYFAGGDNVSISEEQRPLRTIHRPQFGTRYTHNVPNRFVMNMLNVKGQFEQDECPVFTPEANISQQRKATAVDVVNNLWGTIRMGRHKLSLSSNLNFNRAPGVVLTMEGMEQRAQSTTVSTRHGTSFKVRLGQKWTINLPVRLEANYNMVETERIGAEQRISGWRIEPMVSPSTSWTSANRKTHIDMGASLHWLLMFYDSKSRTNSVPPSPFSEKTRVRFEPRLTLRRTISSTAEMTLASNVSNSAGDILDLLTVPVQTGYRTTSAASGVIGKSRMWSTRLGFKKEVPFRYFTFGADASWTQGSRNVLSAQTVSGTQVESSSIFRDSHSKSASGSVNLSKNILPLTTKFTFRASGNWGCNESMSQGALVTTYSAGYNLGGTADVTPVSWLEINLKADYAKSFTRFQGQHRHYDNLSSRASLAVFPVERLELRASFLHARSSQYESAAMLSASAQYKAQRTVWRLSLDNLLNTRHYTHTVFNATDRYVHDVQLIGRTMMLTCRINLVREK